MHHTEFYKPRHESSVGHGPQRQFATARELFKLTNFKSNAESDFWPFFIFKH